MLRMAALRQSNRWPRRAAFVCLLAAAGLGSGCPGNEGFEPTETDSDSDTPADAVIGILIAPERIVVPLGDSIQLKATGLTAARQSRDVTNFVVWGSTNPSVAQVSDTLDQEGKISGLAAGEAQVWAELDGVRSPDVKVEVTEASLVGLTVDPKTASVEVGQTFQLKATAAFSDGKRSDASSQAQWVTSNNAVARIDGSGRLEARAEGTCTVHAEWNGTKTGDVAVTVVGSAQPNLTITRVSGEPSSDAVTLEVTIENTGNVGASDFWLDVFVDLQGDPGPGDLGELYHPIEFLDAGASRTIPIVADGLSTGAHTFTAVLDIDDAVAESDELDNQFGATFTLASDTQVGPNLEVTYFDYIIDAVSIYYVVDVTNTGSESVGDFYVDLFIDEIDEPVAGDLNFGDEYTLVEGLAKGETNVADFLIEQRCDPYPCYSWVLADGDDDVVETDETDNVAGQLEPLSPPAR